MSEDSNVNIQGYNIVTLLKRLEAATSRLEDITIFQEEAVNSSKGNAVAASSAPKALEESPSVAAPLAETAAPEKKELVEEKPKSITAFEEFISGFVTPFVDASHAIDALVGESAASLAAGFTEETNFLSIVAKSKQPNTSDSTFVESLKPINSKIEKIMSLKEQNRRSPFVNHLNTISEGSPALGWVVTTTPRPYVVDFKESAQFWSNRVLKEFKDSESGSKHAEWVKLYLNIFDGLASYVKEYHTTGPSWNPNGIPFTEALSNAVAAPSSAAIPPPPPPPSGGVPPPPPPPPPAAVFEVSDSKPVGRDALFGELNKGEAITAGLKKVDKSQMTHKNPALRESSVVPAAKKSPVPPKKPTSLSQKPVITKKPAKKELVDSKWLLENLEDDHEIVLDGEMNHAVFIASCSNVTIQIKGKINTVTITGCSKIGLVVESLISGIEVIRSTKYGLQITDVCPMISIDQSHDGSVYFLKKDIPTEIFTSQTTSLNINVPTSDDDYSEIPVPEQFKHSFENGKLVSNIVEHSG